MNSDYISSFYICYNWFDVSYDLDYTIGERYGISSSLAGRIKGLADILKVVII